MIEALQICLNCSHTWSNHVMYDDKRDCYIPIPCEHWSGCQCKTYVPVLVDKPVEHMMIKIDVYKSLFDKSVDSVFYLVRSTVEREETKSKVKLQIKDLILEIAEGMKREVGNYGTNTHSYACLDSFVAELRRNL